MATILKCKMCGGDIEVNADMSVGTCIYCGSTMTLPHIDSDKKARLFNMANQYRLNNEFDKAYEAYRDIVSEDEQESEAYWGMILSEYGVEYVEDPVTKRRIPTCHRTLSQSIKDTVNYDMALKYADAERKMMYRDEAEVINGLQKKILSVSSMVEPYDVFICYKESEDDTGNRTTDSVLAHEIYNELEKQGLNTFFARISLQHVLGQDYEPYIYAALHSAKVMLVVSTSDEHCNAVWVKNEWSRYLALLKDNENKTIIPVYKDMSPYELPDELSRFQAQDMSKVGAILDLVDGVKKLCGRTLTQTNSETVSMLLKDKVEREEKEARKEKEQIIKLKKKRKKIIIGVVSFALSVAIIVLLVIPLLNINKINKYKSVKDNKSYVLDNIEYDDIIKTYDGIKISPIKYFIGHDNKIKVIDAYIARKKPEKAMPIIFNMCDNNELNENEKVDLCIRLNNISDYADVISLYKKIDLSKLDSNSKMTIGRYYKAAIGKVKNQ